MKYLQRFNENSSFISKQEIEDIFLDYSDNNFDLKIKYLSIPEKISIDNLSYGDMIEYTCDNSISSYDNQKLIVVNIFPNTDLSDESYDRCEKKLINSNFHREIDLMSNQGYTLFQIKPFVRKSSVRSTHVRLIFCK